MDLPLEINWDKKYREGRASITKARESFASSDDEDFSVESYYEKGLVHAVQLEKQKLNNEPTENQPATKVKPFIPGKVFFRQDVDSALTKKEQAISLNVLRLYQSGIDHQQLTSIQLQDIETYKSLQSKIREENTKFLEYVEGDWKERRHRAGTLKTTLHTYAKDMWARKLKRRLSYAQFYKPRDTIPLTIQDHDFPVDVACLQEVLQLGSVAKFSRPTLTSKYSFKVKSLPSVEGRYIYNSKLPVSQDDNVKALLDNYEVDVVLSSSAMKRLMDDSNFNIAWDIPVVIKEHNVKQADGTFKTKSVIYIDKPLPKQNPSNADFNEQCHKRLVRTNLCQIPGIVYANSETTRINPNYYETDLEMNTDKETNKASVSASTGNEVKNKTNSTTNFNDDDSDCDKFSGDDDPEDVFSQNVIHHNVTYSIWNIKPSSEQNILMKHKMLVKNLKFLVRCKLDACEFLDENNKRPLIITPKLEFQLEHGAGIPTKTEIIRQWSDLFFRPFSQVIRVRLQSNNSEVVSLEEVSMQKINNEAAMHYEYKPHVRLGVLYTVFSALKTMKPGNYLLHHTAKIGPFVELLMEENPANKSDASTFFDLHEEYSERKCFTVSAINKPWVPIDVNYILPVHNTFKRMPGMFKPLIVNFAPKKKRNKKRAAKKKSAKKVKKNLTQTSTKPAEK